MKKKSINQQDIKQANAADVFSIIRKNGPLSRAQLQDISNLSWGSVSNIVLRLAGEKYINEIKAEKATGAGRPTSYLDVNTFDHFIVGLDINASGFKAVLMNLKNEVIDRRYHMPSEPYDEEALLSELTEFLRSVLDSVKGYHVLCVGIAMQGLVDAENGISVNFPMIKNWKPVPIAENLSREFSLPVYLEHDPDCSLYSYSIRNETRDAILVRVDKGIGMAVLMNGEIFKRIGMFELGHVIVEPDGAVLGDSRGTLSAYASQTGLESLSGKPFEQLVAEARSGEPSAIAHFQKMALCLAKEIANIANMLCVKNIVLCGKMWQYKDIFGETFSRRIEEFGKRELNLRIIETEHAATGAAQIAIDRLLEKMQF